MKLENPIETERLLLREFVEDDFDQIHEYGSDPEVVKLVPFGPNTPDETSAFLQRCLDQQVAEKRKNYDFATIVKAENKLIAGCGIHRINGHGNSAAFGYVLNRSYWGKGYATEAARALVKFGFDVLDVYRVEAICSLENIASARVMEKCGMRREGIQRGSLKIDDEYHDAYMYAVLRTD